MNTFHDDNDNRHREVAVHLHNVATLIGERQPNAVEFGEGEKRVQVFTHIKK